jgi:V/A-type H+-transporting ATPase subunit I
MFGLMFPDLGHGIVVTALGTFFAYMYKGRFLGMNPKKIGRMMIWLGTSSSIFGLLFGEFFLVEARPIVPGLRPGWIGDPSSVIWLIKIAIFFGTAQLILAMGLAIIRHLRKGEVVEAMLGQHGLAGIISFIGFLLTAFHFIGITIIPGVLRIPYLGISALASWPFFLMITGIAIVAIKPFIAKEPAVEGVSGMFEAVIAFMANTFSYTRIAGFAVVHAAFAIVVHKLMEVNLLMGIGVGLIFLNLFAITIEFLVCMIQALRLLYYEFFTKFYEGRGFPYIPWKL